MKRHPEGTKPSAMKEDNNYSEMTVREAGRRGGLTTSARYWSTGFYQRIGRKGGKRQKELYANLLAEFGKKGGRPKRSNLEPSLGEES